MLKIHPKINLNLSINNDYRVSIFMFLDCDAGPTELTRVDSLLDFYILFESKRRSASYNLAVKLLELGYSLQILRVNNFINYPSLLLTNNSDLYSHPELGKDYYKRSFDSLDKSMMDTSKKIYGFRITIPDSGFNYRTDYININIDNTHWYYINYKNLTAISTSLYFRSFDLSDEKCYSDKNLVLTEYNISDSKSVALAISDVIYTNTGLITNVVDNNDGTFSIDCYSTELHKIPDVSNKGDIKIEYNEFLNFDVLCQQFQDIKTIEFYSKYTDASSYLQCRINKLGSRFENGEYYNRYNIIIEKLDDYDSVIYTESYEIDERNGKEYNENLFNLNSRLVTCRIFDDKISGLKNLPSGVWKFNRSINTIDANIEDYIRVSDNSQSGKFNKISSDIILDSGLTYLDYDLDDSYNIINNYNNIEKIKKYSNFISNLENICSNTKLLMTSYNPTHEYSRDSVSISIGKTSIDSIEYPTYILPLYLLSHTKDVEGKLDMIEYKKSMYEDHIISNTDNLNLIYPDVTNYEIKLVNPLCYFLKSDVSLDLCIKTLYTINVIRRELSSELFLDEDKVNSIITDVTSNMSNYFSRNININIEKIKIEDRNCLVEISTELDFNYRKYFELIINLS